MRCLHFLALKMEIVCVPTCRYVGRCKLIEHVGGKSADDPEYMIRKYVVHLEPTHSFSLKNVS